MYNNNFEFWDFYYNLIKDYYCKHGNIDIPTSYMTDSGFKLGRWLWNMVRAYKGKGTYKLTKEQKEKLDSLGIQSIITNSKRRTWDYYYKLALEYYQINKHINIPTSYETPSGDKLGRWISNMKKAISNKGKLVLTENQIRKLEDLGLVVEKSADLNSL